MDNASYHKVPRKDAARFTKMKSEQLRDYLRSHGKEFNANAVRSDLIKLCKALFPEELKPGVCLAAEKKNHRVLFTPPYHSDLQPIELVWADVKGYAGKKYVHGITFEQVLRNLNDGFVKLSTEEQVIAAYIKKSYEVALSFMCNGQVYDDEAVENVVEANEEEEYDAQRDSECSSSDDSSGDNESDDDHSDGDSDSDDGCSYSFW